MSLLPVLTLLVLIGEIVCLTKWSFRLCSWSRSTTLNMFLSLSSLHSTYWSPYSRCLERESGCPYSIGGPFIGRSVSTVPRVRRICVGPLLWNFSVHGYRIFVYRIVFISFLFLSSKDNGNLYYISGYV